jgi:hypothetical protein
MPNDYSKTVIYRIAVGNDTYYGHTTQPLHKRSYYHKKALTQYPNRKLYKAMRDAGMNEDDIDLVWVEDYPCHNIYQAKARERYWIESKGTLNTIVPTRTKKEYYDEVYGEIFKARYDNDEEFRKANNLKGRLYKYTRRRTDEEWRQLVNERNNKYYHKRMEDPEWRARTNEIAKLRAKDRYNNDEEWRNKQQENHKEFCKTKVSCELCGKEISKGNKARHQKLCKG